MNGLELSRHIQSLGSEHSPRLILFTSISLIDPTFRDQSADVGIFATLTKPARSGLLLSTLADSLAAEPASDQPVSTATGDDDQRLSSLSVLVVDDNAINRKVAGKILRRLSVEPDIVESGGAAVQACKLNSYDAVLMDIEMPDMDGLTATRLIREALEEAQMPYVVALTANAMASERENYLTSGMDDYLSKPIDVPELVRCLGEAADQKQLRAETDPMTSQVVRNG